MNIPFDQIPSPTFLLDASLLRKNLELIDSVQKRAGVKIILALKGFSMWGSFPIINQYLSGTTASSLYEARLGYEEFKGEVHAYCVAYFEHEFDEIMRYCNHITFNSIAQYEKFASRVRNGDKSISCAIRINPEYSEVETDLYNPCIPGSRLGMTFDKFGDKLPEGIEGLHFHSLCEKDSYTLERTLKAIEPKFGHLINHCKWFNMGGGHLMTKEGYDIEHLVQLLIDFKKRYPNLEEVIMEPGSAIAWQTGYLVSSVQDIIESGGKQVAVLDVSVSAHMPDCIEMPYTARILGAEASDTGPYSYLVGGLTCLAGDYMGPYSFEKPLQAGDRLVFDDMMHYTMVKTTMFNGVSHPDIGIWTEKGSYDLLRKFSYQDFKYRLG
ncbi:MAG: carboxynorspermidine decarboxylase [Bacteroidota bacterium]|nr:carboxynorspermidine decarboxylase [Bacteroidota bacterium]